TGANESMEPMGVERDRRAGRTAERAGGNESNTRSFPTQFEWSERSVLGSRDIDGQTREGDRAGGKESIGGATWNTSRSGMELPRKATWKPIAAMGSGE